MSTNSLFRLRLQIIKVLTPIILLTIVLDGSMADAASIAGSKCTKVGATKVISQITFTCQKVGKKLLWNNGVKISAKTDITQPKVTPTTKVPSLEEQILQLLDSMKIDLATKYEKLTDADLIQFFDSIDPDALEELSGKVSAESVQPSRKFASLFLPNMIDEVTAIVGVNDVYIADAVAEACDWVHDKPSYSCGPGFIYTNVEAIKDAYKITNDSQINSDSSLSFQIWSLLPHEIWHQVQGISAELNNSKDKQAYPSWLREGGAEIAKLMIYAIAKQISYHEARSLYKKRISNNCKNVTLDARVEKYSNSCEFTLGLYASEYLLWKTKDFKSLISPSANNDGNAESTFSKSFKFTLTDFLNEASPYVKSQA